MCTSTADLSLIEVIRAQVIKELFQVRSFARGWDKRVSVLCEPFSRNPPSKRDIVDIGLRLRDAFFVVGRGSRKQNDLSTAGSVWEGLVVWYINLCLVGTHAVCVRKKRFIPRPVQDAMSVQFDSDSLTSEPDVLIISLKATSECEPPNSLAASLREFSELVDRHFKDTGVINIQCKTNWNDCAQVPMLWNMLYSQAAKGAIIRNGFSLGQNGKTLRALAHFAYSFVTAPTQSLDVFASHKLPVRRVRGLSGGYYWGTSGVSGVCRPIGDIFDFVFNKNPEIFPNISHVGEMASDQFRRNGPESLVSGTDFKIKW